MINAKRVIVAADFGFMAGILWINKENAS